MDYEFKLDGVPRTITLEKQENRYVISCDERTYDTDIRFLDKNVLSILIGDKSFLAYIAPNGPDRIIWISGHSFSVQEPADDRADYQGSDQQSQEDMLFVKAPMPGKVIKINVKEQEKVRKNQTLAIVEAMKMENEIKSSFDGRVKKIFVSNGDLVDSDKPLIELENEAKPEPEDS